MLKCKYFYSKAKVLILLLWCSYNKADILKSFYNYQVLSKPSSFIKLVFGRSQTLSTKKNTGLSRLFVVSERDLLVSSLRCDFFNYNQTGDRSVSVAPKKSLQALAGIIDK